MSGNQLAKPDAQSFLRSIKTVAWSFLGIRKNSEFKADLQKVNPLHIMAIGIGAVFLFVIGLMFFVQWVVKSV